MILLYTDLRTKARAKRAVQKKFNSGLSAHSVVLCVAWKAGEHNDRTGNIYYGNIAPHEYEVERSSEYDVTAKLVIRHEQKFLDIVRKYVCIQELMPEVPRTFISKIVVHGREKKHRQTSPQQIDIYFRYIGIFALPSMTDSTEETKQNERRTAWTVRLCIGQSLKLKTSFLLSA